MSASARARTERPNPAGAPSAGRLVLRSLRHHWRINLAVALGVMAGTAVLTGALLVGDSVRGSLRRLVLDRLGQIDEALLAEGFFRAELADELAAHEEFKQHFDLAVPAIIAQGSVTNQAGRSRAAQVTLLGASADFWKLFPSNGASVPRPRAPNEHEAILNAPLAAELGVQVGQEVAIRLNPAQDIPPDSGLGRKTITTASRVLKVVQIVPAEGWGRFGLSPNQQLPHNAWLNLATLQDLLTEPGSANALLVAARGDAPPSAALHARLQGLLQPRLADYGLRLEQTDGGYVQLTSRRMLLSPAIAAAAQRAYAARQPQPVLTYLANTLAKGEREIPYSTITAIDFRDQPPLGPMRSPDGETLPPLAEGEIALNSWAADDLQAELGDTISVVFFEPQSTHGQTRERTVELKLAAIVELEGAAADPDFTPDVPGMTDADSIADWDPPFSPFYATRIRDRDEDYWDEHKATPKAFVSLATGQKLWGSRFGNVTALRMAPQDATLEGLAATFEPPPSQLGLAFQPIRQQGLDASAGTTAFEGLFLGFSFFIIAAALMLVVLLFRLGVQQRSREVGTLLAVGFTNRGVRRLLLLEGAMVAALGGVAGIVGGLGYAWLMLAGLRTWWVDAVTTPFLGFYPTPASLAVGYVAGVLIALLAIAWALRQLRRTSVRRLMAGQVDAASYKSAGRRSLLVAGVSLVLAVVASLAALGLSGEAQAGAFFGSAALVLTALLALVWNRLAGAPSGSLVTAGTGALARLAVRNAARNPGRSTLTIGLVAAASFLIVSISAFRLDPPETLQRRDSGTGGFALVAQSAQSLYRTPDTPEGRIDLGFSRPERESLAGSEMYSLRLRPGDDASCLNLYQSQKPQVLSMSERFIERGGFAWTASAAESEAEAANPWLLLKRPAGDDEPIPVVLDAATATYSLKVGKIGALYSMPDGRGGEMTFEVVGLLKNSIFQGSLLIGEENFLARFPEVSGYRFFLVDAPPGQVGKAAEALESRLGDYGFDAQRADARLAGFMAVQNTYLSTFQSLGGLGLLLGTFGLAVVQLRSVLERRGELALLRATGFRRSLLARMVLWENAALLLGGLAVGCIAAAVAVLPHLLSGGAGVPWFSLGMTLGVVVLVGLLAGLAAVRAVLTTPLLPALRGD